MTKISVLQKNLFTKQTKFFRHSQKTVRNRFFVEKLYSQKKIFHYIAVVVTVAVRQKTCGKHYDGILFTIIT